MTLIIASLPPDVRAIITADRAYGRYQLLHALNDLGQLYVLRCKNSVALRHDGKKLFPKDFKAPLGQAVRYRHVLYRDKGQEPVDLIVYHEPQFKETWYLLVPPDSEKTCRPNRSCASTARACRSSRDFGTGRHIWACAD